MFYNRPEGNVTFSQVNIPPTLLLSEFDNANLGNSSGGVPANTFARRNHYCHRSNLLPRRRTWSR